jgi:hypothetical protein
MARICNRLDGPCRARRIHVTDRGDPAAWNFEQVIDVRRPHAADADIADAYKLDGRRGQRTAALYVGRCFSE